MQRAVLPPLVKAKLSPPEAVDAHIRPETADLLARCLSRRLTVIRAPAGYGKTTVAREAVRRFHLRCVWYKLDVLDQDPVVLIASLVHALADDRRGFGDFILDRLANAHDVPYPIERMVADFVTAATEALTDELHIVLDDYHEAADSPALNRTLDYLVANLPATVRFIVLSRYEPAFGLAKLRLDDELGLVGTEDLRFGSHEVLQAIAARAGTSLTPAQGAELAALTEGWPASVVLAALAAVWVGVDAVEDALADPRLKQDVFSYLAEQVYSRQDVDVRTFLRRTCCLDSITPELAARLTDRDDAHAVLHHLQTRGVFTFAADQEGAFRYHSLFREFLRHKCIQEEGTTRFRCLQIATAHAVEESGNAERAVDLCLTADEPRLALDIVARAGEHSFDAFRADTLESWLERLPDHLRETDGWARLIAAHTDMRSGRYDEALKHTGLAVERFERTSDSSGLYHALSATERTLFWRGQAVDAAATCRRALEVAVTPGQRVHSLISMAAALESQCRWDEATAALDEARELADGAFPQEMARLAAHAIQTRHLRGYYRVAADIATELAPTVRRDGTPSLHMAFLNAAGSNDLFLFRCAEALATLTEATDIAHHLGCEYYSTLIEDDKALVYAAMGDWDTAHGLLQSASHGPSAAEDPYCRSMTLSHAGTLARRSGSPTSARSCYEEAIRTVGLRVAPSAFLNASANLAYTRADLSVDEARARLAEAAARARDLDLLFVALKAEYFAASLLYRDGRRDDALSRLESCVPRQVELGHLNFLVQELTLEPDMALDFIVQCGGDATATALIGLIARHWNGLEILVETLRRDAIAGVTAVEAAVQHRGAEEVSTVLAKAARSPFREVRQAAARLRRMRRDSREPSALPFIDLTPRERQILALMADGHSNPDIARRLVLAPATVKTHVNHIFAKLGARDRVHAVLLYRQASKGESDELNRSNPSRS